MIAHGSLREREQCQFGINKALALHGTTQGPRQFRRRGIFEQETNGAAFHSSTEVAASPLTDAEMRSTLTNELARPAELDEVY